VLYTVIFSHFTYCIMKCLKLFLMPNNTNVVIREIKLYMLQ
jgi:hypothetical protein